MTRTLVILCRLASCFRYAWIESGFFKLLTDRQTEKEREKEKKKEKERKKERERERERERKKEEKEELALCARWEGKGGRGMTVF